jgi:predicted nucleic acid-binding protein
MTVGYLDTNILVGFFKGDPGVKAALERFDSLKIPAMAYAEFLVGLPYPHQREASDKVIEAVFEIVHSSKEICHEAAELRRLSRLKIADAMIYATAKAGGGVLITRDKDFDQNSADVHFPS